MKALIEYRKSNSAWNTFLGPHIIAESGGPIVDAIFGAYERDEVTNRLNRIPSKYTLRNLGFFGGSEKRDGYTYRGKWLDGSYGLNTLLYNLEQYGEVDNIPCGKRVLKDRPENVAMLTPEELSEVLGPMITGIEYKGILAIAKFLEQEDHEARVFFFIHQWH